MNKRLIGGAATVAVGVVLYACGGSGSSNPSMDVSKGTVLLNANVVNTRDGSVTPGMSIVIDGGKIQQIIPVGTNVTVSGSGQGVDASGKYVVPGYLDMHTHVFDGDQQSAYWPLMIANGITGVREMTGSSDLVKRAQQHNADRAAGNLDAPEVLLIPGDLFRGLPPASTTAGPAIQAVQQQKAYGAGFVKIINTNREATLAILGEAKKQGLDVAGHLTPAVSARESSDLGWKAVEHFGAGLGVLLDCANEEDSVRAAILRGDGGVTPPLPPSWSFTAQTAPFFQRVFDSYNAGKCLALAQTFAKNGTWHVPTLIRLRTQAFVDATSYRTDPNLKYVSPATRAVWEAAAVRFTTTIPAPASATFKQYFGLVQTLPKLMKQNGIKMLTGSDISSSLSNWVVPGFSLHQEFSLLSDNGLSPLDILQMTTLNGAEFLNRQSTMGTVDVGKNADLVLLDANPITDAANLDKISGVLLKGKYFSKAALEKMKSDVAAIYASQPVLTGVNAVIQPDHVD